MDYRREKAIVALRWGGGGICRLSKDVITSRGFSRRLLRQTQGVQEHIGGQVHLRLGHCRLGSLHCLSTSASLLGMET